MSFVQTGKDIETVREGIGREIEQARISHEAGFNSLH